MCNVKRGDFALKIVARVLARGELARFSNPLAFGMRNLVLGVRRIATTCFAFAFVFVFLS